MNVISSGTTKRGQSGVVILEALIAVLIFSIGILGLVGTLSTSVSNASEAQYRTEAAFLAESLIAELRTAKSNPDTRASDYASPSGTKYVAWKNRVMSGPNALPGVGGSANLPTVVFNSTTNLYVAITINWQLKNSNSTIRQYIVETALE